MYIYQFQRICTGSWSEKELQLKNIPVAALVVIGSWIAYSIANIALKLKKNKPMAPQSALEQAKNQSKTNLDAVVMTYLASASIGAGGILFLLIQR